MSFDQFPFPLPAWLLTGIGAFCVLAVIALSDRSWRVSRLEVFDRQDQKTVDGERLIMVTEWRLPTLARRTGAPVWWVLLYSQVAAVTIVIVYPVEFVLGAPVMDGHTMQFWYWWWTQAGVALAAVVGVILLVTVTVYDRPPREYRPDLGTVLALSVEDADKLRACATDTRVNGFTIAGEGLAQDAAEYLAEHAHPPQPFHRMALP